MESQPILDEDKVRKFKIPVHKRQQALQILDAAGGAIIGAGLYYMRPLDMIIGKHEEMLT